ncbi:MAG TPA: hypothetical protein VKH19_12080 [Gemmatimonadaceae bacterium]|nr:hypothetical protein [Gemmatimonadaceae bacterium]
MQAWVLLHITGGSLAVISGYAALFAPKGGWLHRRAGVLFVCAMIAMGIGATVVGLARDKATWRGGPLVIYFVVTALTTVRRRNQQPARWELALTAVAAALTVTSFYGAVQAARVIPGLVLGVPAVMISVVSFINGSVLLLGVIGDLRERRYGPLTGNRRLARHLWRMCFAMWVATGSFFLGQPKFIPPLLSDWYVRVTLAVLPLAMLGYWIWRVKRRRRASAPMFPLNVARQST